MYVSMMYIYVCKYVYIEALPLHMYYTSICENVVVAVVIMAVSVPGLNRIFGLKVHSLYATVAAAATAAAAANVDVAAAGPKAKQPSNDKAS